MTTRFDAIARNFHLAHQKLDGLEMAVVCSYPDDPARLETIRERDAAQAEYYALRKALIECGCPAEAFAVEGRLYQIIGRDAVVRIDVHVVPSLLDDPITLSEADIDDMEEDRPPLRLSIERRHAAEDGRAAPETH